MEKEPAFFAGDVIELPPGTTVLVNRKTLMTIDVAQECIVEASRFHEPGLRTDHFSPGEVVDVRPLLAGEYNYRAPLYSIALSGDFSESLIVKNQPLKVIKRMRKVYENVVSTFDSKQQG